MGQGDPRVEGRVVLVTGAAGGIGRAIARAFSESRGNGPPAPRDQTLPPALHGRGSATDIAGPFLLLDEPTAGMGDQETYQITQLIRGLHGGGALTIVLIEHDTCLVFSGPAQELAADEARIAALASASAEEWAGFGRSRPPGNPS